MDLANPAALWLLTATAALALWLGLSERRRRLALERLAQLAEARGLVRGPSPRLRRAKAAMLTAAFAAAAVALAQPRWGVHVEEVKQRGIDIYVLVDTSRSMLAEDVGPSRLGRAKREVLDLLQESTGDRVGLIAFAGTAFVQCPLTPDYGAVRMFLEQMEPDLLPRGGTAIGEALRLALRSFDEAGGRYKAVILITDGEDHTGGALEMAEAAAERGVPIFAIGIGSPDKSPIPIRGDDGAVRNLQDRAGRVVMTALDEALLQRVALTSGGAYVRATPTGSEMQRIYDERIAEMEKKVLETGRIERLGNHFQLPLLVCALLLLGEAAVGEGGLRAERRRPGGRQTDA